MKKLVFPIISVFIGLLTISLLLELVFRILPTSDSEYTQAVNSYHPYLHLLPNRDIQISKNWNFSIISKKHVNNYGHFSDIDYKKGGAPQLVVIGSSLVTANQVPNSSSFHGILNSSSREKSSVYMLAGSNAPHTQYLAYARQAITDFNPDAFCIVIGNYYFSGSLLENALPNSGYHYYDSTSGKFTLKLTNYESSGIKSFLRNSAVARYLFLNANISHISISNLFSAKPAHHLQGIDFREVDASKIVIDNFLADLKLIVADRTVLFVLDSILADRYSKANAYDEDGSTEAMTRAYFKSRAIEMGFDIVDMAPVFYKNFEQYRERFEFPDDNHWNALGHQLVAKEILRTNIFNREKTKH